MAMRRWAAIGGTIGAIGGAARGAPPAISWGRAIGLVAAAALADGLGTWRGGFGLVEFGWGLTVLLAGILATLVAWVGWGSAACGLGQLVGGQGAWSETVRAMSRAVLPLGLGLLGVVPFLRLPLAGLVLVLALWIAGQVLAATHGLARWRARAVATGALAGLLGLGLGAALVV